MFSALGSRNAQGEFIRPSVRIHRYVGIKPPLKYMVKTHRPMAIFPARKVCCDSG